MDDRSCSGKASNVNRTKDNTCQCECFLGKSGSDCSTRQTCHAARDCIARTPTIITSGWSFQCGDPWTGAFCDSGNAVMTSMATLKTDQECSQQLYKALSSETVIRLSNADTMTNITTRCGDVDAPFRCWTESAWLAATRARAISSVHDLYGFVYTILQLRSVLNAP